MKKLDTPWTLDDLTREVEASLAEGYGGAASGRVRDIPDRRTIRYYTTLGLIDRPAAMRGRTALYGRRHLLQLVAIKKLQAEGRALAEIQQALTGQTDAALSRFAGLADDGSRPAPPEGHRASSRQEPVTDGADKAEPEGRTAAIEPPQALAGIPLHHRVTLLLNPSRPVDAPDLEAIRTAAIPLLRALSKCRLIETLEEGKGP